MHIQGEMQKNTNLAKSYLKKKKKIKYYPKSSVCSMVLLERWFQEYYSVFLIDTPLHKGGLIKQTEIKIANMLANKKLQTLNYQAGQQSLSQSGQGLRLF